MCIFHPFSGHKLVNRTVWIESILSTNQANCVTILESFRNYIKQKIQKFQELQDPKPNYVILIKKCVAIPDTYLFIVTRSAVFSYLTESLLEIFTTCMFNMHKKKSFKILRNNINWPERKQFWPEFLTLAWILLYKQLKTAWSKFSTKDESALCSTVAEN